MDRAGADAGVKIRALKYALIVLPLSIALWSAVNQKLAIGGARGMVFVLAASVLTTVAVFYAGLASADAAGAVARAYTMPSGASTPYEDQFSYQDALAARGDVAGALDSLEAVIAERPGAAAPRLKAAELYVRQGRDPRRAAALFREVRNLAGVAPRDALYATSRLVDLYDGPLGEPGRALVELRRIIELHPTSELAAGARIAIARRKGGHAAAPDEG